MPPQTPPPPPIRLRGVRQNNLKGVDVDFPYDQLTVVTGVSGSGKSSLVFDTLYAEGQRRYVESFSAYARQFLERMQRPDAERIEDLPPAVAVGQANPVRTSRSTVGTMTELTDHLKLLFAKVAKLHCARCDQPVEHEGPAHLADAVDALAKGSKVVLTCPLPPSGGLPVEEQVRGLRAAGLFRIFDPDGGKVSELTPAWVKRHESLEGEILIDRVVAGKTDRSRVLDSAEQGLRLGRGHVSMHVRGGAARAFSAAFHCAPCDRDYRPAQPNLFSFNSPLGACPTCRGFGRTIEMDLAAMVPDPGLTLARGAIRPWTTPRTRPERRDLRRFCERNDIDMDTPWRDLTDAQRESIQEGTDGFFGLRGWMEWLKGKAYKMHVRVLLARYRTYVRCEDCGGSRRRPEALLWRLGDRTIHDWETLPIGDALGALRALAFTPGEAAVSEVIREALDARLSYLHEVGLGYLTLDRSTRTLSGGEFQRVNLATALGAALVNTLYVLDEPSVGLHPRDTDRLLGILHKLRDRGNTLVVVEHDPETIRAADHLVDLGPGAGELGGEVLYQGPISGLTTSQTSLTARFLRGEERMHDGARERRDPEGELVLTGACGNNLKDVTLRIPGASLCVLAGVSGSGKSSLLTDTLFPAVRRALSLPGGEPLPFDALDGLDAFRGCELVDQAPIGRTPRSNPATYTGAMSPIRKLFAATEHAKRLRLREKAFSFNSRGGRCPACDGAGQEVLEMQFLADVYVPCEECEGKRFKREVLEVRYHGKSIDDVLALTVDEACGFFAEERGNEAKVRERLLSLRDVGLGYLRLGQPAPTLSGGEAQRLKLAAHLPRTGRRSRKRTLFLFDEPTTGLHLADVRTLIACLERLVNAGHTVVVIEHHLSVMAAADHLIELGPEGGDAGGRIIAAGTPEQVARTKGSVTAPFLRQELGS